jgi:DsbC/DsbD-like thiol-disulfide interchange protein
VRLKHGLLGAILGLAIGLITPANAQDSKVALKVDAPKAATAGKAFYVAVHVIIPEGYHIQANTAKDPNIPTVLKVVAPKGVKIGKPVFPKPATLNLAGEQLPGFEGEFIVTVPITLTGAASGPLALKLNYQACNDTACFPPASAAASVKLPAPGKAAK